MLALIVEDNELKAGAVTRGLRRLFGKDENGDFNITDITVNNGFDAMEAMELISTHSEGKIDFIILDMQFPIAPNQPPEDNAGLILLEDLQINGFTDIPVIINTSFSLNKENLLNKYPQVVDYIHYNGEWDLKEELRPGIDIIKDKLKEDMEIELQ